MVASNCTTVQSCRMRSSFPDASTTRPVNSRKLRWPAQRTFAAGPSSVKLRAYGTSMVDAGQSGTTPYCGGCDADEMVSRAALLVTLPQRVTMHRYLLPL